MCVEALISNELISGNHMGRYNLQADIDGISVWNSRKLPHESLILHES